MRPTQAVAFAVILAIVLCGTVAAGPRRPQDAGDPDIYEGTRPRDRAVRERLISESPSYLIFEIPFCHSLISVRWGCTQKLKKIPGRMPAAPERNPLDR
jgi:hypothetical protein